MFSFKTPLEEKLNFQEKQINKEQARDYIDKLKLAIEVVNEAHAMIEPFNPNELRRFKGDCIASCEFDILGENVWLRMFFSMDSGNPYKVMVINEDKDEDNN